MEKYPPPLVHGRRFKVLYAAQQLPKDVAREIPTLQLFVNSPGLLTSAYERYLELQLREAFELTGCPIKFVLRGRSAEARDKTREKGRGKGHDKSHDKGHDRAHAPAKTAPAPRRAPKRGSGRPR